ncbi:MAG: polymer-forming cytoskeletal protein [Phycisphaeraceae bacterium]
MTEQSNEITVIASDTKIKGEMSFDRAARINGQFEGKITAKGELQIAPSAKCKADVQAASLIVDGSIEGNIRASQRVQVNAKGRVKGDIVAEKLVAAEGASVFGHVAVGPDAMKAEARPVVQEKVQVPPLKQTLAPARK